MHIAARCRAFMANDGITLGTINKKQPWLMTWRIFQFYFSRKWNWRLKNVAKNEATEVRPRAWCDGIKLRYPCKEQISKSWMLPKLKTWRSHYEANAWNWSYVFRKKYQPFLSTTAATIL